MANYFYKGKEVRSRSDRDQDVKLLWAHTVTLKHTYINFRVTDSVATLYRVRSLALQPLSAGNSAEFSQADNSKTIQHRATNLISLDSLGACESIYVSFKPKPVET